jgi:chlorobactene glucosyltransferase
LLIFAIVCVLIGRAIRQRGLLQPPEPAAAMGVHAPRIEVIVPARDEAANISPCLAGLLAQNYPQGRLGVTVVDDGSSDGTPDIVTAMARERPGLTLMRAPALADGWTGKCQACWLAARNAEDADWLCFIDADMRAEPALIATALATAEARQLALVSLAPRHELGTFAERLMIPCGLYVLAFRQDLGKRQAADREEEVTVTGQFMLIRRDAYMAVGGHAAVRGRICEDLALAALLKRSGHPVLMFDGASVLSTRMYDGWASLWIGISKNLEEMLGGLWPTLITCSCAFVLSWALYAMPIIDALSWRSGNLGGAIGLPFAAMALAAALGLHIAGARHFRIPLWYGFLFPLGYAVGLPLALDSIRRRATGQIRWKGRTYP